MDADLLTKRAQKIQSSDSYNGLNNEFRIIPDWNFTCGGNITGIFLGAEILPSDNYEMYPEIQLWRLNQVTKSSYSRQEMREIRPDGGYFTTDGMVQINLTHPIQFQNGDIVAIYQPKISKSSVRLFYDMNDKAPLAYKFHNLNPKFPLSMPLHNSVADQYMLLSPLTGVNSSIAI